MRTSTSSLFTYARGEGYLPADYSGVPRPTKRRGKGNDVKVFIPDQIAPG